MIPPAISWALIILGWTLVYVFVYFTTGETIMDKLLRVLYWILVKTFFREISVSHQERIPKDKPVMLVCAPHANQFVDGMVISTHLDRKVYFVGAASSFRKYKVVGLFMKLMASIIPVERHQDVKKVLTGTATVKDGRIIGQGTQFTKEVAVQGDVVINNGNYIIAEIVSDTELVINKEKSKPTEVDASTMYPLTVGVSLKLTSQYFPHIDYNKMFKSVWDHLAEKKCVAIFPEGGSHDQSNFLPFKAGVSIMSLGFLSQYPDSDFYLIPVGMNYFKRDSFRQARAFVDVGEPIAVPRELVARFKEGGETKRAAVNELLGTINLNMYQVTTMAPDWATLNCVNTARHVLTGKEVTLSTEQKLKLNRNLVNACERFEGDAEVAQLRERLDEYQDLLACTHQTDYNISQGVSIARRTPLALAGNLLKLLVCGLLCLPGLFLSFPGIVVVSVYSSHYRRNALRKSSVKISAMDVLATGKVVSAALCFIVCVLVEPAIFLLCCSAAGYQVTFLDYLGVANILPWLFYLTIFLSDYCTYLIAEVKFGLWSIFNVQLDKYILRQREQLKTDLNAMIEKKGPELFGSAEEFERKRVLKDGAVSLKRVKTTLSLNKFLPDNLGDLAQEVMPHIFN